MSETERKLSREVRRWMKEERVGEGGRGWERGEK